MLHFSIFLAVGLFAQTPAPVSPALQSAPAIAPAAPPAQETGTVKGGTLHGSVKAGNIPLPGASVTAKNTLTGKQYTTVTDINGAYTLLIPANGRYVLRTDLAGFATATQESLLNATSSHDQTIDFAIQLASRAEQATAAESGGATRTTRQQSGNGVQSLSLSSLLGAGTEQAGGKSSADAGSTIPSAAQSNDFGGDSLAVNGQAGVMNPMAGLDADQLRSAFDLMRSMDNGGGLGGDNGGGPGGPGGGRGGGLGGGFGGRGGRGNFRNFKPNQVHGALYWDGNNSALNASPFALGGYSQPVPPYGSNHFGGTIIGAPMIPGLLKPTGLDTVFLNFNISRSSSINNPTGSVPTANERSGYFSDIATQLYNPTTHAAILNNDLSANLSSLPGYALFSQLPACNISPCDVPGTQNYHRLITSQSNNSVIGARYIHTFGPRPPAGTNLPPMIAQFLTGSTQKFRQTLSANFNYSYSAADQANILPFLGGSTSTTNYSLQLGYSLGYQKLNNNLQFGWNRSTPETTNYFTGKTDPRIALGITAPIAGVPFYYGYPNVSLSGYTGFGETQPSLATRQTITVSEGLSWIHGKHNMRFGGELRFVQNNTFGGGNSTGSFLFTGCASSSVGCVAGSNATGNPLVDLLFGRPQETSVQALFAKAYMRQHTVDAYAMDDWRILSHLTLNYGVRYEYFAPYTELNNRLATLDYNQNYYVSTTAVTPNTIGSYHGRYNRSLVAPFYLAFAPRLGFAWRVAKDTIFRGGYGINYNTGQYGTIGTALAKQTPFADVQTNEVTNCAAGSLCTATLANGFQTESYAQTSVQPNYAINPHYAMPYVQAWNLDLQRTIPWGIVLNLGYNGSKGTHLDITSAPRPAGNAVLYNFETAEAFSIYHGLTVRARKRLQKGVSLGATYVWGHSIDDAGSVGGTSTVVAQNYLNFRQEESNSSFDQRHKLTGDYLFELPFGPDKYWLNTGNWLSQLVGGLSVSGSFTFASGSMLTPRYSGDPTDVANGTAGTLRPNVVPGISLYAGAHSLKHWFNTNAYSQTAPTGTPPIGNAPRDSIVGPGTISNNMALSRTQSFGGTRSLELRASLTNAFNTVQYSGVNTDRSSALFGQITGTGGMRSFQFLSRFRF